MKQFFISFIFLSLFTFGAIANQTCANIFFSPTPIRDFIEAPTTLWASKVNFLRVPSQKLKSGKLLASNLNSSNALFIGIQPNGHMYIVTERYRFDGDFIHGTPTLKETNLLNEGIVIRLEDSDGSLKNSVENYFFENGAPKSLNCVSGVCKVLGSTNELTFDKRELSAFMPLSFLRKTIQQKVTDKFGRPVRVQLFILGDRDVNELVSAIRTTTHNISVMYGLIGPIVGAQSAFLSFGMSLIGR